MTTDLRTRIEQMEMESDLWIRSDVARFSEIAKEMMILTEDAEPGARARALRVQGNGLRVQGQLQQALVTLKESLAYWKRAGEKIEWARTQTTILPVLTQLGRHKEAIRASEAGLEVFLRHNELLPAARLLSNTGGIYYFMGRPQQALRCFTRAEELAGQGADEGLRARINLNRAMAFQQVGRYTDSLTVCAQAMRYNLKAKQHVAAARVLQAGATALFHLGRFGRALRRFARARETFAAQSAARDVAVCDLYICACYLELNRNDQALIRVRAVLGQLDPSQAAFQYASGRFYEGVALARLGRLGEGYRSLSEANRWFEKHGHSAWAGLANLEEAEILLRQGAGRQAVRSATRAGRCFTTARMPVERARASLLEAEGHLLEKRLGLAEIAADQALSVFARTRIPGPTFRCLHVLGRIALRRGDYGKARRLLERAVRTAEKMRATVQVAFRRAFLDDKANAYADLVWLHLQEGRVQIANRLADRAKSRALVDALATNSRQGRGYMPLGDQRLLTEIETVRRAYQELINPIRLGPEEGSMLRGGGGALGARRAELEERLTALWDEWELHQATNVGGYGVLPKLRRQLSTKLDRKGFMVEYFLSGSRLVAFVSDRRGLRGWVDLGSPQPIQRDLELLQLNMDACLAASAMGSGTIPPGLVRNAKVLLGSLYQRLWAPLLPMVGAKRQAVIIPHGLLHLVPFEALHDGQRYLLETVEISLAPSREAWLQCMERSERLVRGPDLVMGYDANGALPFVDEEVNCVAGALGTPALLGRAAVSSQLMALENRRVLHMAVHGEFRSDNPFFSTLLLADGPITASDVSALRLSAALVVLSGCETGLSRITRGDELLGLISAFLHAGSVSVLASRWRVDDKVTAELMQYFYVELLAGKGKAAALRGAQRSLAEQEIHPLYWAAFGLVGHGGAL